jgi:hypothetical protein
MSVRSRVGEDELWWTEGGARARWREEKGTTATSCRPAGRPRGLKEGAEQGPVGGAGKESLGERKGGGRENMDREG